MTDPSAPNASSADPVALLHRMIENGHELPEFVRAMDMLGIRAAYTTLTNSPYEASRCASGVHQSIRFLGHTASKWGWKDGDPVFNEMLQRLADGKGEARFLLSADLTADEMFALVNLRLKRPCLQVRIYTDQPVFRLVIVDDSHCGVQYYPLDPEVGGGREDWPVLQVGRGEGADIPSLFDAFARLFDEAWLDAEEL